ncbi:spermidine acetyltransferase [Photobacterium sanguinicancri]|uniref:Spermidine acetyltransferase n=2 Tax=Photobacterium sanguinicancri TaxID=875932 RepID=A0ABX4FSS0_9GAMM|nr:spermidine acetyltransferase [Photobacterium sanguinicancri]
MMSINFLKINGHIAEEVIKLAVGTNQDHLIATNAEWLTQANFNNDSIDFAIYHSGQPAGLISLIDPRIRAIPDDHFQPDHLYVWRLMIDHAFQGKGIGNKAVNFAKNYAQLVGLSGVSLTTMDNEQGNAKPLYLANGFTPTGRRLDDEIELIFSHD